MVIEAFLRFYDLVTFVEAEVKQKEKRVLGLAKQKLIYYLAYVKQEWTQIDMDEFLQFYITKDLFVEKPVDKTK